MDGEQQRNTLGQGFPQSFWDYWSKLINDGNVNQQHLSILIERGETSTTTPVCTNDDINFVDKMGRSIEALAVQASVSGAAEVTDTGTLTTIRELLSNMKDVVEDIKTKPSKVILTSGNTTTDGNHSDEDVGRPMRKRKKPTFYGDNLFNIAEVDLNKKGA